jgi:branched-chain amino acid transport system permease protein
MGGTMQFLLSGLVIGSIYALSAIAYTAIYNVTGVINFAQGDMAMFASLVAIAGHEHGLGYAPSVVLAVLVGGLLGAAIDRIAVRPVRHNLTLAIIVTIGVGIILQGAAMLLFGTEAQTLPSPVPSGNIAILGASLPNHSALTLVVAALLMVLLGLLFQGTYIGRAFRACAVNPMAARLVGINVGAMSTLAFVLSGVLAAIAGVMIAPITLMQYDTGVAIGLKGFVACMIGGLGNPMGALFGGLFLGVLEAMTAGFLSSGYKNAIAFVLLIGFLMLRPGGLLGNLEPRAG